MISIPLSEGIATTVEVDGFGEDEKSLLGILGQHMASASRLLKDENNL
jgi:hypothetical protein